ncbi:DUF6777 domain-containing protein [Embleya sp. NPDC050154]|uniref:DUF6777 domain-containing protein n=1 Tax=unclassified Embleya TaxID=2699296 RepID=UPI003798E09E
MFTACALLLGAASGCADAKVSKVVGVVAGDLGADPFFSVNFGLDALGLRPKVSAAKLSGDTPGLFGGSNKARICDKEQLIQFLGLAANLVPATRWMKVLKVAGTPAIRAFVTRLTPVVLRTDTLVRNHTLKNGALVAFDAILQAGTAVLIDELGQPVVKCNCGNPLAGPEKDAAHVRLDTADASWKRTGSKPTTVKKAKQPVKTFVITDPTRPDLAVARPPGSAGDRDAPTATPPPLPERGKKATPSGSTGSAGVTGPSASASSTSTSTSTATSTGTRRPSTSAGTGGKSAKPASPAAASVVPALR